MGHRRRVLGSTMELQWHEAVCVAPAYSRMALSQIFIMYLLSLPCPLGEESPDGFLPTGPLHTLYSIALSLSLSILLFCHSNEEPPENQSKFSKTKVKPRAPSSQLSTWLHFLAKSHR